MAMDDLEQRALRYYRTRERFATKRVINLLELARDIQSYVSVGPLVTEALERDSEILIKELEATECVFIDEESLDGSQQLSNQGIGTILPVLQDDRDGEQGDLLHVP